MEITITSRSGELTNNVKEYAAKKLKRLERILPKMESAQITEDKERAFYIVEITLVANGLLVRGQERSTDLRSAIDLVVDKLERQVKKYREKLNDRHRQGEPAPLLVSEFEEIEEGEAEPASRAGRVVRSKRFPMKPLNPEDAAAELELLGHDFYVFTNAETDKVNVIYRRQDGNYGLIEPEF